MNMNDLDKQPDDDGVQMVDLDDKRQPIFPFFYRLIQRYGKLQPRVHSIILSFALISGLIILLLLILPTFPQHNTTAPKSQPIIQTNLQYLDVNITTNQTMTFLHRADSQWLIAQRNSDGREMWRKKVFPGASYLCSQREEELIYCGTVDMDKLEFSAVRTTNGAILWKRQFEGEAYWQFSIIKNKSIYIADSTGNVSAFNAQNGFLRWTWKTESSLELDSRLVFGDEAIAILGINGKVDVLNPLSGKAICQYQSNENNWFPIIEHNRLYAHTNHQSIQAFDLRTGRELWQYSSPFLTPWSVTAANDIVYVHENYTTIQALRGQDGQRLWRYQTNGMMTSPAVPQKHTLYIATQNATITALNREKGELLWQKQLPLNAQIAAVALAVTGNTIYVNLTLREGTLYALRADNGQELWYYSINHLYTSSPLLSEDGLYLEQNETHLEAKNANDGAQRWQQSLATPLVGNLQESGSMLYVRESSGLIEAIRSSDGKELWHISLTQLI